MTAPSRAAQFTKLHKILKKYYTPVEPDPNRPVLEQLLYGCLLENAHYAAAEEAYAALVHGFFDWNEVRVSSVRELAEAMHSLPDPPAAANRIKRVLQNVFEATYAFDLEELRKLNLGPAVERLKKVDGASEFAVSYVVQVALGGHSIPIDSGTARSLYAVDLVAEENVKTEAVPGLERAIPKSKGTDFGSLLHQLGADYVADPYSSQLREILAQVDPIANERMPKRRLRKPVEQSVEGAAAPGEKSAAKGKSAEKNAERKKKPAETSAAAKASAEAVQPAVAKAEKSAKTRAEDGAEATAKKKPGATKKRPADKPAEQSAEKPPEKSVAKAAEKKSEKAPEKPAEKKKPATPSKPKSKPESESGKTRAEASELAKRKPR